MTADVPDHDPSTTASQREPAPSPGTARQPYPVPPVPAVSHPPAVPPTRHRVRGLGAGAVVLAAVTLAGAPLGLLWLAVAPSAPVAKIADGPNWPRWRSGSVPVEPQPEQFISADGWFTLLGLAFGVLAAITVWLILSRQRGPVGLVTVVLGTLGAGCLAWWLGGILGMAEYQRIRDSVPVAQTFSSPPLLRAGGIEWVAGFLPVPWGVVLVPAFGAAVVYTLLAGWSRYPTLRPEPAPPNDQHQATAGQHQSSAD